MKILFSIALPIELKTIQSEIKSIHLKGIEIDFLLTGVGVLNNIYSIKNYIQEKQKPDFLVNIGVCGKIDENFNDFFQVYRIKNLSNNKETLCPIYIKNLPLQSIACSNKIITNINELGEEKFVDMESFGVDFVCSKEKIPYIIIKKPFDKVSSESKKVNLIELEHSLKGFDYIKLIEEIQIFGEKNKIQSFEKQVGILKEKHRLTFSETELLKKYINKSISFGENTKDIFKKISQKEKSEVQKLIK